MLYVLGELTSEQNEIWIFLCCQLKEQKKIKVKDVKL